MTVDRVSSFFGRLILFELFISWRQYGGRLICNLLLGKKLFSCLWLHCKCLSLKERKNCITNGIFPARTFPQKGGIWLMCMLAIRWWRDRYKSLKCFMVIACRTAFCHLECIKSACDALDYHERLPDPLFRIDDKVYCFVAFLFCWIWRFSISCKF